MGSMQKSVQSLNAALDRLEKAVAAQGESGSGEATQLRQAVDGLRQRNEELSAVADQAAQRLDRTIGRVTALLEA